MLGVAGCKIQGTLKAEKRAKGGERQPCGHQRAPTQTTLWHFLPWLWWGGKLNGGPPKDGHVLLPRTWDSVPLQAAGAPQMGLSAGP